MKKLFFLFCLLLAFATSSAQYQKNVRLALVSTTNLDRRTIHYIKERVAELYNLKIDFIGPSLDDSCADNGNLIVSNVDEYVAALKQKKSGYTFVVGLTHNSLFAVTIFSYVEEVYGYSNDSCCIISDHLIPPVRHYNKYVTNVVLHEIGHLLSLEHCPRKCLMTTYDNLGVSRLCYKCYKKLRQNRHPKVDSLPIISYDSSW